MHAFFYHISTRILVVFVLSCPAISIARSQKGIESVQAFIPIIECKLTDPATSRYDTKACCDPSALRCTYIHTYNFPSDFVLSYC